MSRLLKPAYLTFRRVYFFLPSPSCNSRVQLFRERLSEKKHATMPKGKMGHDQYTVPKAIAVELFLVFSFSTRKLIRPWPLVPFFQISLKNSTLKIIHVHFFRQPFSK